MYDSIIYASLPYSPPSRIFYANIIDYREFLTSLFVCIFPVYYQSHANLKNVGYVGMKNPTFCITFSSHLI